MSVGLWIVQVLLAAVFLLMGGMKLVMPAEEMTAQTPFPEMFLRFIGTAEVLAAFGLILPGVLRLWTGLTPLAAAGLVIIMVGATVTTIFTLGVLPAIVPFVLGVLSAFVAYGRWRIEPLHEREAIQQHDRGRVTQSISR